MCPGGAGDATAASMWAVTEPDFDAEQTGAQGTGLATMAGGTVLDTWFPAPRLIPAWPSGRYRRGCP